MIVVPQHFLQSSEVQVLLKDGLNCVVYKETDEINADRNRYVTTHAFTFVQSGELKIRTEEGQVYRIKPGELVFLPKSLYMISDIIPRKEKFKAIVFFIEDDVIDEFLDFNLVKSSSKDLVQTLWVAKDSEPIQMFTDTLIKLFVDAESDSHKVTRYKLMELLHILKNTVGGELFLEMLNQAQKRDRIPLKKFMRKHYSKPLKIEDYAHLTGRSIASFHRDFKRVYKVSPKSWLIEQRLEKAKKLIQKDLQTTITQIAFSSGYENIPHFIKAFQKRYGISPKQYQMQERDLLDIKS